MKRRSLIVFTRDPSEDYGQLCRTSVVGVVFFPSLPFMGAMLFPSFVLGSTFGEGGALHVLPSPVSVFLFLPLSPSPSFSSSFSFTSYSPLSFSFRLNSFHPFFFFSSFPSFSTFLLEASFFFFLRELLVSSISKM